MKKVLIPSLLFFCLLTALAFAATPVIFYSDLTSGPNSGGQNNKGVFVTIWGKNFGTTKGTSSVSIGGGQADNYPEWSDTKVCFQLGANAATGNIVLTTSSGASNGLAFIVRPGNIYFVDPNSSDNGDGTYSNPFNHLQYFHDISDPGDTVYIRAGLIADEYDGHSGWHSIMCPEHGGIKGSPIAWIAYPGEKVTLQSTGGTSKWPDDSDNISYIFRAYTGWHTISKLNLIGGGNSAIAAGEGWKIVGCNIQQTKVSYAVVEMVGDYCTVIGNEIHDCGNDNFQNMNHSIYVDGGSLNFEIGWNYLHDNKNQGWEISLFHQGTKQGTIHDNLITNAKGYTLKGILVGNVDNGEDLTTLTTQVVKIYNNVLYNLGINIRGGAIQLASGIAYLYNNTIYKSPESNGTIQLVGGTGPSGNPTYYISNNIIYNSLNSKYISNGNGGDPVWSNLTLTNNCYYGAGNGPKQDLQAVNTNPMFMDKNRLNFYIQADSPCINAGAYANKKEKD